MSAPRDRGSDVLIQFDGGRDTLDSRFGSLNSEVDTSQGQADDYSHPLNSTWDSGAPGPSGIRQRTNWGKRHFAVLGVLGILLLVGVAIVVWTTYFNQAPVPDESHPFVPLYGNLDLDEFVLNTTVNPHSVNARWAQSQDVVYSLEGGTLYAYESLAGKSVLVAAEAMAYNGQPLDVFDYAVSPDASHVILFTNKQPGWRHSFLAEYYLLDVSDSSVKPLTGTVEQLQYVCWSPSSAEPLVAYVQNNAISLLNTASGVSTQVSTAAEFVLSGIPDWSYEEEVLETNSAMYWSPDGALLAWMSFDVATVHEYTIPVYANNPYPANRVYGYPAPGYANAMVDVWVYSTTDGGAPTHVQLDADGLSLASRYVMRVQWADTARLSVRTMNRLQNTSHLLVATLASPPTTQVLAQEVLTLTDDAWIDAHNSLLFFVDSSSLSFVDLAIAPNGYRHIALYTLTTPATFVRWVTSGDWEVSEVNCVDESTGVVYYTSTQDSPLERNLFAIPITASTAPLRLSSRGWNDAAFSPSKRFYWLEYKGPGLPASGLYETTNPGQEMVPGTRNTGLGEMLEALELPTVEYMQFASADPDVMLNAYMVIPPRVTLNETTKKFPVLMYVYGGPGSQTVTKQFFAAGSRSKWHMFLASRGYIVVSVDNRGTGARGQKFLQANYLHLGEKEVLDQLTVADQLADLSYVDGDRIGVWGWSFGGYMTTRVLCTQSPRIKLGMAVAPVTDWRFYDSIYTERYMRTPEDNPDGYALSSVLLFAKNINPNALLLVHGTGDDNVHFLNSMELVNSLVENQILFEMMAYPNQQHGLSSNGTQEHVWRVLTRYVMKNL